MKTLLYKHLPRGIFLIVLWSFGGCAEDDALPTVQPADLTQSPLLGTWVATERTVTAYVERIDTTITLGNNVAYEDSTYTEAIREQFTFGVETQTDSVLIEFTPVDDTEGAGEPLLTGGIWTSGAIDDPDGPLANTQYVLVLDPSQPRLAVEEGYYRTYTIRDLSENTLSLSYTATDRIDRNSLLYETTYTRQ